MENINLNIKEMILIGSTGRNSGKTTFATELIERWKNEFPVIALKITTIHDKGGKCIRGGEGCGACLLHCGDFEITEETNREGVKDTSLLLASGAQKVYWMRCLKDHHREGISRFMEMLPKNAVVICESNTLRKVVKPGLFVVMKNTKNDSIKSSAKEVIDMADLIIENDFTDSIKNSAEKIKVEKDNQGKIEFIIVN